MLYLSRTLALLPLLAAHLATARGGRGGVEVVVRGGWVGGRAVVVVVAPAAVVVVAGHASLGLSIEHIHTAWPPSGAWVRGCW